MEKEFKIGDRVIFDNKEAIICHFIATDRSNRISESKFARILIYEYKTQITVATDLLRS